MRTSGLTPGARKGLRELIRATGYLLPHVVGTCSIGPRPDDGAVVDSMGRVHGTERLSVIDASIIPNGPSAFTHIPTIMLAERLAEQTAKLLAKPQPAACQGAWFRLKAAASSRRGMILEAGVRADILLHVFPLRELLWLW